MAEYDHSEENCTVIGMGVYRGQQSPDLDDIYFSADYCSGKLWGLVRDDSNAWVYAQLLDTNLQISGAGMDEAGELYVTGCACEYQRGYDPDANSGGTVWRLVAADQVPEGAETAKTQEAAPQAVAGDTAATPGDGNVVQVSEVDGRIEMPASLDCRQLFASAPSPHCTITIVTRLPFATGISCSKYPQGGGTLSMGTQVA